MQISTAEVRQGKHDGKTVYVCDYRREDLHKKAGRNVKPTKAIIKPISEASKTVYYSQSYFAPLSKKGQPLKRVISPVDNTGYRSRQGNELYVFDNLEECEAKYNELLELVVQRAKAESNTYWSGLIDELEGHKADA